MLLDLHVPSKWLRQGTDERCPVVSGTNGNSRSCPSHEPQTKRLPWPSCLFTATGPLCQRRSLTPADFSHIRYESRPFTCRLKYPTRARCYKMNTVPLRASGRGVWTRGWTLFRDSICCWNNTCHAHSENYPVCVQSCDFMSTLKCPSNRKCASASHIIYNKGPQCGF